MRWLTRGCTCTVPAGVAQQGRDHGAQGGVGTGHAAGQAQGGGRGHFGGDRGASEREGAALTHQPV